MRTDALPTYLERLAAQAAALVAMVARYRDAAAFTAVTAAYGLPQGTRSALRP